MPRNEFSPRGLRIHSVAVLAAAFVVVSWGGLPQTAEATCNGADAGGCAICGDGIQQAPEECDLGSQACGNGVDDGLPRCGAAPDGRVAISVHNGDPGACCTVDCKLKTATDVCRPTAGLCDVAEMCTGSSPYCPADAIAATNSICRPAPQPCDVAEVCDGISTQCPADAFQPSTTVCHPSSAGCDPAEVCSGSDPACPMDVNNCTSPTRTPTVTPTSSATVTPTMSPIPAITCPAAPIAPASCRQFTAPRRHRLAIDDWNGKFDRRDRLEWGWRRGEATALADFGNPLTTTSYAACLYNGAASPALIFSTSIPAGPLWRIKEGFIYTNPALDQTGIRRISLKSRGAAPGKASIRVVGAGRASTLGDPNPTGNFPILGGFPIVAAPNKIRFQLINSNGLCWEGTYQNRIRRNQVINSSVSRFRAHND